MKFNKSFVPATEESFLNESYAFGAYPSAILQPSSSKFIAAPFKPAAVDRPLNASSSTNSTYPTFSRPPGLPAPQQQQQPFIMFPKTELKLSAPDSRPVVGLTEKTGYNFISVLKEFTDHARVAMSFDYAPGINCFICTCKLQGEAKGQGRGSNKQEAKKEASKNAILKLLNENRQHLAYFSRFINLERGNGNGSTHASQQGEEPEEDLFGKDSLNNDNEDNEYVVYFNQYCQQKYQTNPTFEYEPSGLGYCVVLRCEKIEQRAEGASKKAARQNAAKAICESLGIKVASQSIIDEVTLRCQKILKKTPTYTFPDNTEDNKFQCRITCGDLSEIGIGRLKKDAKLQAVEKLMNRLDALQKPLQNPVNNDSPEISQLLIDLDDKENVVLETSNIPMKPIGKPILTDITNRNKHQELFLTYAEDKLSKLIPNPSQDKGIGQNSHIDIIRVYDRMNLEPKDRDLKLLNTALEDLLSVLSPHFTSLKIDRMTPVGSYITNSLRSYKFELDVLVVYDSTGCKNPLDLPKTILAKLRELLLGSKPEIAEKYSSFVSNDKRSPFLQVSMADEFKIQDVFHQIKLIPVSKTYPKLAIMLRCHLHMFKAMEAAGLSPEKAQELKILRRVLKCLKDIRMDDMRSDVVDILIFNITRKFSEIDIVRNVQRFFEFIALGGLSCNKENGWFWAELPEFFLDYVRAELSNETLGRIEREAKTIVEQGLDKLLTNFKIL